MRKLPGLVFAAAIGLGGCAGPARPEITVYTKRDYRGASESLRGAYPDLAEDLPDFDDEISSFEIRRGVWELCKKPRYRRCRTADRSMPDLGAWDLDNAIRSLRPVEE
jgi:hypothetical protein